MQDSEFIRLLTETGTWQDFEADWRSQCSDLDEDYDAYAEATLAAVRDIIEKENRRAGVFALRNQGKHHAMCQINKAGLPGYPTPVLRVRFMTLCPDIDLKDMPTSAYGDVLASLLKHVFLLAINDEEMNSKFIKFHLRSPADVQFFSVLGKGLHDTEYFEEVVARGAWLYITLR